MKQKYEIIGKGVIHSGKKRDLGETIELTEEQARLHNLTGRTKVKLVANKTSFNAKKSKYSEIKDVAK